MIRERVQARLLLLDPRGERKRIEGGVQARERRHFHPIRRRTGADAIPGTVRSPKRSPVDTAVLLFSDDQALWHERFTTTKPAHAGGDGRFSIDGLRAGRYFVIAVPREDGTLENAPSEYFALLARHATAVTINEAGSATVNLTLVRWGD